MKFNMTRFNRINISLCLMLLSSLNLYAMPIKISSNEGMALMNIAIKNKSAKNYFVEAEYFTPQKNRVYCGPTSAAIILNSLGVQRPFTAMYAPDGLFSQENIFTKKLAEQNITPTNVFTDPGMVLDQVTKMLNSFGSVKATAHKAMKEDQETMTNNIIDALNSNNGVIGNIQRTCLGEEGGGHFSPITSYAISDDKTYFLFMDVSSYKDFGHVWVSAKDLYKGMSDKCDGSKDRGYIIIKKTKHN